MLVVRIARASDLDAMMALARQAGNGMTTLKPDRALLERRLAIACDSFDGRAASADADYVFVLEDLDNGRLAGISAIKGAVGLDEPFYNYRLDTVVHSSAELGLFTRMRTLYLSNDLTGTAELCSLFLLPEYRSGSNGKLLSKSRLLFLAQFPHLFGDRVFAEMRGVQRADGSSPFFDAVGRHFFKMDFGRADDLTSFGKKSFIAELMPRQPLYAAYLPAAAQQAIGQTHENTSPARRLLEQEGMHFSGLIDIFDAGPVLEARRDNLRAMRESELTAVSAAHSLAPCGAPRLVSSLQQRDFRVIVAAGGAHQHALPLSAPQQRALGIGTGELARHYRLAPPGNQLPSRLDMT